MTAPKIAHSPKPLLTRDDLPLEAIAEICRRYGIREMAIDSGRVCPAPNPFPWQPDDDPFESVDLYLIVDFGPGECSGYFNKNRTPVTKALYDLLGSRVWIEEKEILERHIARGAEWPKRELAGRDIIYVAEYLNEAELAAQTRAIPLPEELPPSSLPEVCRQWNVAEVAMNYERMYSDLDRLRDIGSQFIVGLHPDESSRPAKERLTGFTDAMRKLFGAPVSVSDKATLERASANGDRAARKELEGRGVIYSSE